MADFLSRLAARSMGATALAEPRVPARFSPGAEQTAQSTVGGGAEAGNDGGGVSAGGGKDPGQEERRSSFEAHRGEAELAAGGGTAKRGNESVARQPAVVRAGEVSVRAQAVGSVDIEPHVDRGLPGMNVQSGRSVLNEFGEAREGAADSSRDLRQEPPPTWPAFAEPLSAPTFARSGEGARSGLRDLPSNANAGFAAPTVRITIGRIDVRAERPSQAPAPVPRTRPSTVSLDQFLKRSAGAR